MQIGNSNPRATRKFEVTVKDLDLGNEFTSEVNAPNEETAKTITLDEYSVQLDTNHSGLSIEKIVEITGMSVTPMQVTPQSKFPIEFTYKTTPGIIEGINKDGSLLIRWGTAKAEKAPVAIDADSFWSSLRKDTEEKRNNEQSKETHEWEVRCPDCEKDFKHDHEEGYDGDLKCPHCGFEDSVGDFLNSCTVECSVCGHLIDTDLHGDISVCVICATKNPTDELNIVSCGDCGKMFTHKVWHEGDLKCPHCGIESEQCDFPDAELDIPLENKNLRWRFQKVLESAEKNNRYARLEGAVIKFFVNEGVLKTGDFWVGEGAKYWDLEKLFADKIEEIYILKAVDFTSSLEEQFSKSAKKDSADVDSLIWELDSAVESHNNTEQTVAEEEIKEEIKNIAEQDKNDVEKIEKAKTQIVDLIKEGGPIAFAMYGMMEKFPSLARESIESRTKTICDAYKAKAHSQDKWDVFITVAYSLFKEQWLIKREYYKSAYELAGWPHSKWNIKDPSTWINSDDSNEFPDTNDIRWTKVKWDYNRVLEECKKQFGTLEDLRENANETLLRSFCNDYFDNNGYKRSGSVDEVIQSGLITIKEANGVGLFYWDEVKINPDAFIVFSKWDRIYRASEKWVRASEITNTDRDFDSGILRRITTNSRDTGYSYPPWGTTVETSNMPIESWCKSFTLYKNGNVKLRVYDGVAEKIKQYIMDYKEQVAKKNTTK